MASRTFYYESWDTLDYHYDADGVLVSQTGKLYDLDMEADVTITFRPDGTRKERREHWINYEDPTDISDEIIRYDERDEIVYEKGPWGITEYEIEYIPYGMAYLAVNKTSNTASGYTRGCCFYIMLSGNAIPAECTVTANNYTYYELCRQYAEEYCRPLVTTPEP